MTTSPTAPPPPPDARCPHWCVVLHAPDDHPRDRVHQSASLTVPVTQLRGIGVPDLIEQDEQVGAELALSLHHRIGTDQTWLYVGDGQEQGLEMTVDSWARLVPAVERLVTMARQAMTGPCGWRTA